MHTIGLQQMLADMERTTDDGSPHEFHLIYLRGTGKKKGTEKVVKKARKLGHAAGHNHKQRGTIPLYDVIAQRPFTPFIDNILYYNGIKVLH